MVHQEIHLVSNDVSVLQKNVFGVIRGEWNRQQTHVGLQRGAVGLVVVAAFAGSHDVGPDIFATLRYRRDVITRQLVTLKHLATIQAQILIALEQSLVVQRWNVLGELFVEVVVVTFGADDGGDVVVTLLTGKGIDAAVEAGEGGAEFILHHV